MRWYVGGGGSSPNASNQLPPAIHSMTMKGSDAFKLALNIWTQCGWLTCAGGHQVAYKARGIERIACLQHGRHFLRELFQITRVEGDFDLGTFHSGFGPIQEGAQHDACGQTKNE
jgi:hypothetical protein